MNKVFSLMCNKFIQLLFMCISFLIILSHAYANDYAHTPSVETDYHYTSDDDRYCNILNFIKICGSLDLLSNEIKKLGYSDDFVSDELSMRLGKKLSLNSPELNKAIYTLSKDHPLSEEWNRYKLDVKNNRSNSIFRDKRVKLAFYDLFTDFPKIDDAEAWIEFELDYDKNITVKINDNIRKVCDLVSTDVSMNICAYMFLERRSYMFGEALSLWVNGYLTIQRSNNMGSTNVYIVKDAQTKKFSPNVDRVGNLYLLESDLIGYANNPMMLNGILRHEAAHQNYFYIDIQKIGTINAHSDRNQKTNPEEINLTSYGKDFFLLFSKNDSTLEPLIDLHAINDLKSVEDLDLYMETLSRYAAGEKLRRALALLAINYKKDGGNVMGIAAYIIFKQFFSGVEYQMKNSGDPVLEKLDSDQSFPLASILGGNKHAPLLKRYFSKYKEMLLKQRFESIMKMARRSISYLPESHQNNPQTINSHNEAIEEMEDILDSISGVKSIFAE